MHIIFTGFSHKSNNSSQNKKKIEFADIRIVAIQDDGDDLNLSSQNAQSFISDLQKKVLNLRDFPKLSEMFKLNKSNVIVDAGNTNTNKNFALRFSIPIQYTEDFVKSSFLPALCKYFTSKNLSYTFDSQNIIDQVLKSKADADAYAVDAKNAGDFVEKVYKKLDSQEGKDFLRRIVGTIRMPIPTQYGPADKGWEYVHFSELNSLIIYAKYRSLNPPIEPKFVCSPRQWATYFNRRLKPGAIGAVIQIPKNNKSLDTIKYEGMTDSNYFADIKAGGARGFRAIKLGNEQNLPPNGGWEYGYVYDESQTELMTDYLGNPLPDILNDPKETRRITNVGNDTTLTNTDGLNQQQVAPQVQQTQQQQPQTQTQNDNIFGKNQISIKDALENVKATISIIQTNSNRYDTVLPILDSALMNNDYSYSSLYNVIYQIADVEFSQFEKKSKKIPVGKEVYCHLTTAIVMLCGGFGDDNQVRQLANQCIKDRDHALYVHNVVSTIMSILNGTLKESLIKEDVLFQIPSFDEFLGICGISQNELMKNEYETAKNIQNINEEFRRLLKKLY